MSASRRENPYYRLLLASLLTCWISAFCFAIDLYPGSPFGVDWRMLLIPPALVITSILLIIPAGLFALFFVWPLVLVAVKGVGWIEKTMSRKYDWGVWIGSGVILDRPR